MDNYRVLLVAPDYADDDQLDTVAEVRSIQKAYQTEQLRGRVTVADIYELAQNRQFDIIHFAGHGSEDGIDLGGEILTMDMMARIVRKARTKLVYLNSCDSARLGQYLLNRGVPAVIMTATEIADMDAWSMAGFYYAELQRNGGDFRAAYRMVRDEDGVLIWLSNGAYVDPVMQTIQEGIAALQALSQRNAAAIEAGNTERRRESWTMTATMIGLLLTSMLPDIFFYWRAFGSL